MTSVINRQTFVIIVGGNILTGPLGVEGQAPKEPRVGYLSIGSASDPRRVAQRAGTTRRCDPRLTAYAPRDRRANFFSVGIAHSIVGGSALGADAVARDTAGGVGGAQEGRRDRRKRRFTTNQASV
jgi:hypothetical protein